MIGGAESDVMLAGDVCAYISVSKATLSRLVRGKVPGRTPLPHVRIGRVLRFRRAAVERWLVENESCVDHSRK